MVIHLVSYGKQDTIVPESVNPVSAEVQYDTEVCKIRSSLNNPKK